MINNPVIFYISSVLIISFALLTLFAKNVMNSLLAAIIVFFTGAIFFYILGSEYNAIIQAAVYGIAVPIIIGISIMFNREEGNKNHEGKNFILPYFAIMAGGIFLLAFVYVVMISLVILPDTFNFCGVPQVNSYDVISAFANGIFRDYVWAFELVSLLLTIVIAGLAVIGSKRKNQIWK